MSSLFFGNDKDQTLIAKYPSDHSFLYCSCLGTFTSWGSIMLTWKHGEQSDVLAASFSLLAEHVPTVVNLSMYRALVGTVWATIRTGASIHHGQVTYSTLSGKTKWSFWRNVNNSQWTIRRPMSTLQLENWIQRELSLPLTSRASCARANLFPYDMSINCSDTLHMNSCWDCWLNSSSCDYPIVLITQKITPLCTTRTLYFYIL